MTFDQLGIVFQLFGALGVIASLIYFGLIFSIFKHFENTYSQRQRGFIDDESWGA